MSSRPAVARAQSIRLRGTPGCLVLLLFALPAVAEERAERQDSPLVRQVAHIEERIEQLRELGEDELADEYQQRLAAGLKSFAQSLYIPDPREPGHRSAEAALDGARTAIDELQAAGVDDAAARLRAELRPLEEAFQTGRYDIPPSDEPEVHSIELVRGSTLPERFSKGTDRFKLGYAEVRVDYTARPVVLVLSGTEPILWNVTRARGARVHAVLLYGQDHRIAGLSGPLVLTRREFSGERLVESIQSQTGRVPATRQRDEVYSGTPIVIGPTNQAWARQYLLPQIEHVAAAARTALQTKQLTELDSLRFNAVYFPPGLQSRRFDAPAPSYGEFTLAGPIAETLMPLKHDSLRQAVTVSSEPRLQFALSNHHELVVFEGDGFPEELTKVPLSSDLPGRARFRSLAYDSERHRLLLAPRDRQPLLYAYDIETGEMAELQETDEFLAALAYAPEQDVVWGLTTGGDLKPLRLLKLSPDGKTLSTVELPDVDVTQPAHWAARGGSQLIPVDGRLVLIVSPPRDLSGESPAAPPDRIYVLDPASGETFYTGPVQVQYRDKDVPAADSAPASVAADGVLAEIDRKFARADSAVARLRQQGATDRAAPLIRRLEELRQAMQGHFPERDDQRLFLVGIHESHAATVRVTDKSGPITLAVCSYNPATWTIEADEGVDLRRIIVGGYHVQTVKSSPPGVPIEIHCREQGGGGFHTYGVHTDGHQRAVEQLKEYTDLEISALVGTYGYGSSNRTVLVGPEDGDWRSQQIINGLDRLIEEANVEETNAELARIDKHRFYALHFGAMPRQPQPQPQRRARTPVFVAPFTTKGPLIGQARPISRELEQAAVDSTGQTCYVRARDEIYAIDLPTGAETHIPFDNTLPRLSWPSGLAIDSKRERLLLTSYGGGGYLYSYDLAGKEWSVLRRPGIGTLCMDYAGDQDVVYSLDHDRGNGMIRAVKRYNAHGAFLDAVTLARPIHAGRGMPGREKKLQLACAENHLLLLSYDYVRHPALRGPQQQPPDGEGTITVIDTTDGQIIYEGALVPHVEHRDLTEDELATMWEELATAKGNEAEQLMWNLAAGHEATVDFLATRFRQPPPEVEADVAGLIEELDSNKFAEREAAYKTLVELGSRIAPDVRQAIDKHRDSTEIQARLRSLVQGWESAEPPTADDQRQVRAVEALARLATPEAKALLKQIADDQGNYAAARRAALILDDLDAAGE